MLIDNRHRRWFWATLLLGAATLAVYFWLDARTPGGVAGGSLAGMAFGIVGSGLMVYAGLLSALRRVPSWWWLGKRSVWLKGHIWLGLLSSVFLACHSGFHWGGPLEFVLWLAVLLTLGSGIVGLVIQQIIPRLLTARFPAEAPYEQIPHLCNVLRHRADEEVAALVADPAASAPLRQELTLFHDKEMRPFLEAEYRRDALLARPLQRELFFTNLRTLAGSPALKQRIDLLETFCDERRQWGEIEGYYWLLHSWLLVHVPASVLVLVLGVVHVVSALYY